MADELEQAARRIVVVPGTPGRRAWRRPAPWGLAAAVLVLHGAALDGLGGGLAARAAMPAPMQVRMLAPVLAGGEAAAVARPETPAVAAPRPPVVGPVPAPAAPVGRAIGPDAGVTPASPVVEASTATPAAPPEPVVAADPPPATPADEARAETPPADGPWLIAAATPGAAAPTEPPPPLYATRLPGPLTLAYELQRGLLGGSGELAWRPQAGRYELQLDGKVAGLSVITQISRGTLGANGLAPERFTDQRLRRAALAANFVRERRVIAFSGNQPEQPLLPGAQDRLSWMLQLAGIVAAEPALAATGQTIALQVAGARGDVSVWRFRATGRDGVRGPDGEPLPALRFEREARAVHDTGVEVWLDPSRQYLPVRARMRNVADDEVFELRLRSGP